MRSRQGRVGALMSALVVSCALIIAWGLGSPAHGSIQFEAQPEIACDNPQSMTAADFDGDGFPDLAVTTPAFNNVVVLIGDGEGGFETPVEYAVGRAPSWIAAHDFDADGSLDLVVTNFLGGSVSVLLGNGDGTFEDAVNFDTGLIPSGMAVADFDSDDDLDIAVVHHGSSDLVVLFGDGTGDFPESTTKPLANFPSYVIAADVNGDDAIDLVTTNSLESDFSVLLGDGEGEFDTPIVHVLGVDDSIWFLVDADIDDDGTVDLVLPCPVQNQAAIFSGNDDGTFEEALLLEMGVFPVGAVVKDFDGDGFVDVATLNNAGSDMTICPGDRLRPQLVPTSELEMTFFEGDLGTVPEAPPPISIPASSSANFFLTTDLDDDRRPDLVVASSLGHSIQVYLNRSFPPGETVFRRGDVDADGDVAFGDLVQLFRTVLGYEDELTCRDAADVDDNGALAMADVFILLTFLFVDSDAEPAPPGPYWCGGDPTPRDGMTDCESPDACL